MKPLELYIHIPFCVRKCNYCDFLSAAATAAEREEYVESLCQSIRSYGSLAEAYRVVSIFVGGGTPSILLPGQMQRIFEAIRETFFIADDAEITLEMNPGTVDEEKLETYRSFGVNRLSIGLQSADDAELKVLGRIHTYSDFLETYKMARKAGFQNINIDLMSAIPGQKPEDWERTLERVIALQPEHISAYSLIIEEGTPFYEMYGAGGSREAELPDEETERAMYWRTEEILRTSGYHRYEISNYAKPGYECRHNLGYWELTEYLGIGSGAASLMDHCRFVYGDDPETRQPLSMQAEMEEFMFLGLRKTQGVSKAIFMEKFGKQMEEVYGDVIAEMKQKNLLEEAGDDIRLTHAGTDLANYVMSEFLL